MATLQDIAKYKKSNGRYDIEAIMVDTGEIEEPGTLTATFASFFGGTEMDESGQEASELVQLARAENERMAAEESQVLESEVQESLQRLENGQATNSDYDTLVAAGYGYADNSDESGPMRFVFTGKPGGDPYGDQVEM